MKKLFTYGHYVTLPEMLAGREARAVRQKQIIDEAIKRCSKIWPLSDGTYYTLISFTLNIAGPVKVNALTILAFEAGMTEIKNVFGRALTVYEKTFREQHGYEGYLVVNMDPEAAKRRAMRIEETHPLGRLFDIDVLNEDCVKVSRTEINTDSHENEGGVTAKEVRRCLICGAPVSECASIRRHSVSELQEKTWEMIWDYLMKNHIVMFDTWVPAIAYSAMIAEVQTTPKPGLVDMDNSGSHDDMDFVTFDKSAAAIAPYFGECFKKSAAVWIQTESSPEIIFNEIRQLGIETEKTMLSATGGVNTHKGLIFSLGILCAAMGTPFDIFEISADIARPAAGELTATGGRGTGARGEAAEGFPTVREVAIPAFEQAMKAGFSVNDAGVYTLLRIVENTEDTNMLRRGGWELAKELRDRAGYLADVAQEIMSEKESEDNEAYLEKISAWIAEVRELDASFITHHMSPGGCADLLAITYFIEMKSQLDIF